MTSPAFWMALAGLFFAIRWVADRCLQLPAVRAQRVMPRPSTPVVALAPQELPASGSVPVEELREAA